jgi:hypothetical protein
MKSFSSDDFVLKNERKRGERLSIERGEEVTKKKWKDN